MLVDQIELVSSFTFSSLLVQYKKVSTRSRLCAVTLCSAQALQNNSKTFCAITKTQIHNKNLKASPMCQRDIYAECNDGSLGGHCTSKSSREPKASTIYRALSPRV